MKSKSILIAIVFLFITSNLIAQGTDQDGNSFNTTSIGSQVWMTVNLHVSHFRNGDTIPEIEDSTAWAQASKDGKPAWCYYWSDRAEGQIYGKLYNWYAVNDPRGLAPVGWHIPSDKEWTDLTTYLGGEAIAGTKMKENINGYNGSNESGFKGDLGGMRGDQFGFLGQGGCWWSSSEYDNGNAWDLILTYDDSDAPWNNAVKGCGMSIRCIKDDNGNPASLTEAQVNQTTAQEKQVMDNKLKAEKAKGAAFLATNGKRAGVISLPSGVQYEVLQKSNSTVSPTEKDTVVVNYIGTLIDGTELANSYKSNQPLTTTLNGNMIKGWKEILRLMHVGNKFKVYIPSSMAWGDVGAGASIPGSTVIFEIELLDIKSANKNGNSLIAQVTDIDGNTYNSVNIGKQEWMTSNLNVSHFRNGDEIPEIEDSIAWQQAGDNKKPAWCYYHKNPANKKKYGKLYNWYAVNDPRGLAPGGWHVPADAEWTDLITYLGGDDIAGGKMKAAHGWYNNGNGTNESGFTNLPGGSRYYDGTFTAIGQDGTWWSSSNDPDWGWGSYYLLGYGNGGIYKNKVDEGFGFSVRCLKD